MPIIDGYEFASMLYVRFPELKNSLFAISGDESKQAYTNMKKVGVHRFIKKPINVEHFIHFVKPFAFS